MNYRIQKTNELYHYGVKGMKWGVRKDSYASDKRVNSLMSESRSADKKAKDAYSEYKSAKKTAKAANKEYSKAYDKAYNFSARHPITQHIKKSKNYKKSNDLWGKAYDAGKAANVAKANKKQAKANLKIANKNAYNAHLKAIDIQSVKNPKDLGRAYLTQFGPYKAAYTSAKNAQGSIKKKAKSALSAYANTPYREIGLGITYNTTVKRNLTGGF